MVPDPCESSGLLEWDLMENNLAFDHAFKVMGATQQLMARSLINLIEMISTSSHRYARDNSAFTDEALLLMQKAAAAREPDSLRELQNAWAQTCMKFSQSQTRATMGFVEQFGQQVLGTIANNPFTPLTPSPSTPVETPITPAKPSSVEPLPAKSSITTPRAEVDARPVPKVAPKPKLAAKPKASPKPKAESKTPPKPVSKTVAQAVSPTPVAIEAPKAQSARKAATPRPAKKNSTGADKS